MGLCALGIYTSLLPFALRYGLVLLFSAVGGLLPATVLGWAPSTAPAPHLVPTANGLVVQGSHLGQMIGPPAVAAIAVAAGGWQWSPVVIVAAAALGIGFALLLRRHEGARRETPGQRLPVVGASKMRYRERP
jgi:MFS family permease